MEVSLDIPEIPVGISSTRALGEKPQLENLYLAVFDASGYLLEYVKADAEMATENEQNYTYKVALTPTEYAILHLLMANPGKVFSTKVLYESVWQEAALGSEGAVAVHIRHLREKIEINPSEPRYLKVVWGQGYKMEGGK